MSNKTALITGATGGIGRALVSTFQSAGYCVVATDQCPPKADLTCDHYVQADLARFAQEEDYAKKITSELRESLKGHLDLLINNAAIQILGGADNLTRQDWNTTLDINLLAPFLLTQVFLRELEASKGCVINIGSIHSRLTKKNFVAYATSKAALAGMTRALAVDLGPRVRINGIEPGAIETPMLKDGFRLNPDMKERLSSYHPVSRIGMPDEVSTLALMVANGKLGFLQGSMIEINGGIGSCLHDPA